MPKVLRGHGLHEVHASALHNGSGITCGCVLCKFPIIFVLQAMSVARKSVSIEGWKVDIGMLPCNMLRVFGHGVGTRNNNALEGPGCHPPHRTLCDLQAAE